jgi:outer membrane protein assembly factor BamB
MAGSKPGYATPISATFNGQSQLLVFIAEGLIGLDPATGQRLWTFPWLVDHDQNTATPIVRENTIFFTTAFKKGSVMLDLAGNQPKPIWKTLDMQSRFPNPVICNGRIYGMQDPGKLVCLDLATGKLLWSRPGFEFPSTMAADGCVFVLEGKSGDLILLDAHTPDYRELGRIRPAPGPNCWTAPIISNGRLLVRNETSLVCVELQ